MEQKQELELFIGPAFESRSKRFNNQRTVNLYPEVEDVPGKGGHVALLLSRPGLTKTNTIGIGPIRGTYTISTSQLTIIVSGSNVYQITSAGGPPVLIGGNLLTTAGSVSIADNGIDVIIVDGQYGYTYQLTSDTPVVTQITSANFYPADTVTFQGGYFILEKKGTSFFFLSDLDNANFPPLNEQSASSSPDIVVSVISNNEQLYILGAKTVEIWLLTGASASAPFSRITGRVINIGCTAPFTVQRLAGTFLWLGANDQGDGVVYSMENDTPTRVSNHAIEYYLQNLGDLSTSTAFALQYEGHQFYVLNLPGAPTSLVYDMTTKQWHEWTSIRNGVESRFLGTYHSFLNGEHVIGDFENSNIYTLSSLVFKDNGEPLRRTRQSPHYSNNLMTTFYGTLEIDMDFGVGLSNGLPNEVNPNIVLYISNDGGETWGNPLLAGIGKIGQYKKRARWNRLGKARDRVFRVVVDDPVSVNILSAYCSMEIGTG